MGIHDIEVKAVFGEDVVDIPTMREMGAGQPYISYVEQSLFFVDHHDVLRSVLGQWPIAVTRAQVLSLIAYLQTEVLPRHDP